MDALKRMRELDLFQGAPVDKLRVLAERSRYRTYKAGGMFIGDADPASAFSVVIPGPVMEARPPREVIRANAGA